MTEKKNKRDVVYKKRYFVRTIRAVRDVLCKKFGYKNKPLLIETSLLDGELMVFKHAMGHTAILYDYKRFKQKFGDCEENVQHAYVASMVAHEMRHYYQHRQMWSKAPREDKKTLDAWLKNEENVKVTEDGYSFLECFLQPLELDATLYEYRFGADVFSLLLTEAIHNEEHFDALEKLHVEYFGDTDTDLFNDEVRQVLRDR